LSDILFSFVGIKYEKSKRCTRSSPKKKNLLRVCFSLLRQSQEELVHGTSMVLSASLIARGINTTSMIFFVSSTVRGIELLVLDNCEDRESMLRGEKN
jgi:hypothetical protein